MGTADCSPPGVDGGRRKRSEETLCGSRGRGRKERQQTKTSRGENGTPPPPLTHPVRSPDPLLLPFPLPSLPPLVKPGNEKTHIHITLAARRQETRLVPRAGLHSVATLLLRAALAFQLREADVAFLSICGMDAALEESRVCALPLPEGTRLLLHEHRDARTRPRRAARTPARGDGGEEEDEEEEEEEEEDAVHVVWRERVLRDESASTITRR